MPEPSSTQRRIVLYPAPVLLRKAAPVERIDEWVRRLVEDMIRVMRDHEGAGIAAPQVGESVRIFVVEERQADDGEPAEPLGVYINPVLSLPVGAVEPFEEGCLSLPDIRAEIRRPPTITISATDLEGRTFTRTADGFLARVWQHEFDHLEGTLILDRMTSIDRIACRRTLKELQADWEEANPPVPKPEETPPPAKGIGRVLRGFKRR
ncbi:MAG: peptide deformylase [Phycisphaerae bacterium]|jgi:peptide deformylase|nr:peptide deformylase [Phycisphaerae bacterium]